MLAAVLVVACEQSDAFFVIACMLPKRRFWKDEQKIGRVL